MAATETATTTAGRVTATATSRRCGRWRARAAVALASGALAGALASCGATTGAHSTAAAAPHATARDLGAFAWLRSVAAPHTWSSVTTASGAATLSYPPGWRALGGDPGSVSAALRDSGGNYLGYLNVTPRQGAEQARGWAGFRTQHNAAEGDRNVRETAAGEGLPFIGANASCVIDDYLSRVGSHRYREIACLVTGSRASSVFVGAAAVSQWRRLAPLLERAAAAFQER
jgi:hypothetical protein